MDFDYDEENDCKEQEFLVYVDFGPHLPFDELVDPETQIKIIGLDTDTPLAQVNGRFYQGDYDYAMGTKLFFAESDEDAKQHWFGQRYCGKTFKFMNKTDKVLNMKRIFVTTKGADDSEPVTVKSEDGVQNDKYKVTTTYSAALSRFLPPGTQPPRDIPPEEDGAELLLQTYKMSAVKSDDNNDHDPLDNSSS